MQVHVYHINIVKCVGHFSYNIWILLKTIIKESMLINLQNNSDGIIRYGCNGNTCTHVHHVDPMYLHKFTSYIYNYFIDRMGINFKDIYIHFISSELWRSGYNVGLVIWMPFGVGGSNPTVDKIFLMLTCSVFLAAWLAAFKWNQAWYSSELIGFIYNSSKNIIWLVELYFLCLTYTVWRANSNTTVMFSFFSEIGY